MYSKIQLFSFLVFTVVTCYSEALVKEKYSPLYWNSDVRGWIPIPSITTAKPPVSSVPLTAVDTVSLSLINSHRLTHQAPTVTYSTTLRDAAIACAQTWAAANPGPITVATGAPFPRIYCPGQNAGITVGYNNINTSNGARAAIDDITAGWFGQYVNNANLFPPTAAAAYNTAILDYTQMIWVATSQCGCGFSRSTVQVTDGVNPAVSQYIFLCLWTTPGNIPQQFAANVLADI